MMQWPYTAYKIADRDRVFAATIAKLERELTGLLATAEAAV
jgi:hypothetical protein